jgi:integrase
MADPRSWSRSLGTQGEARVRVYERHPGSKLYMSVWLPGHGERRTSLGHRDKRRAVREAEAILALRVYEGTGVPAHQARLTLGVLFRRYVTEGKYHPDGSLKTEVYLRHVARTGEHLGSHFGSDFPVEDLTPDRIREYVRLRREGAISGHPAGASTIQRDLGMLKAALNWACTIYDGGQPILARNPLDKVKFPRERNPKRPVLEESTILRLMDVAPDVHPFLRTLIVLARRTGRRLSAILNLRWDDVDFADGVIRWRAEHDKLRRTWTVPMHPEVQAELVRFRKAQGVIGNALLFPHPRQSRCVGQAVTRHLAAWWLREAFRRGRIEKPAGSLWHMFRRVWATDRKHLPPKDVAAAGGWLDIRTLQQVYQQPDDETLRAVVDFERPQPVRPTPLRPSRQVGTLERTLQLTH